MTKHVSKLNQMFDEKICPVFQLCRYVGGGQKLSLRRMACLVERNPEPEQRRCSGLSPGARRRNNTICWHSRQAALVINGIINVGMCCSECVWTTLPTTCQAAYPCPSAGWILVEASLRQNHMTLTCEASSDQGNGRELRGASPRNTMTASKLFAHRLDVDPARIFEVSLAERGHALDGGATVGVRFCRLRCKLTR